MLRWASWLLLHILPLLGRGINGTCTVNDKSYSVRGLIHASEPLRTELCYVEDLLEQLSENCWGNDQVPIIPIKIRRFSPHWWRMYYANLSFPILIGPDGTILDGVHRLLKAYKMGYKTIVAKQFKVWPEER